MASRLPPLLEPCLATPPRHSLTVLTGVLGVTTNWLVLRCLYSILNDQKGKHANRPADDASAGELAEDPQQSSVVLVSFMREFAFWRDGARRIGLDLESLAKRDRFIFVDGLTSLFLPLTNAPTVARQKHIRKLTTPKLEDIFKEIQAAVADLEAAESKVIVVIDQLDLLLAIMSKEVSSMALHESILDLRDGVHAMYLTLAADEPFLSNQQTTLEKEHAALLLSLAHEAERVISLRHLDTGTAKDVSGVIRITPGGGDTGGEHDGDQEFLYFVAGDGNVKVFERGQ